MAHTTLTTADTGDRSVVRWLELHWFGAFVAVYGTWVVLPLLAPLLMHSAWVGPARAIYAIYSVFCHQLPERSFFLFGPRSTYSLAEIQTAWQPTLNPMILRQFIGNASMGWKVAWSDRMVSLYTSVWIAALVWWPLRRKLHPIPWWTLGLLLLPILVDGLTHAISDFSGIGQGFRDSNAWLATLTGGTLPLAYAGDALGSFNSLARLVTGILAGAGIALFAFPQVERSFATR